MYVEKNTFLKKNVFNFLEILILTNFKPLKIEKKIKL